MGKFYQLTNDKVLTAFCGALIALVLKAIYDSIVDFRKGRIVRKMIKRDLKRNLAIYKRLKENCEEIYSAITASKENFHLAESNRLSTSVFKSHSYTDYYKSLHKSYYNDVIDLYVLIEAHSKIFLMDEFRKYEQELIGCESEANVKIKAYKRFSELMVTYGVVIKRIEYLLMVYGRYGGSI